MPAGRVNSGRVSDGLTVMVVGVFGPCADAADKPAAENAAAANSRVARISVAIGLSPAKNNAVIGSACISWFPISPLRFNNRLFDRRTIWAPAHRFAIVAEKF